jgi:hypothetical protein
LSPPAGVSYNKANILKNNFVKKSNDQDTKKGQKKKIKVPNQSNDKFKNSHMIDSEEESLD